MFVFHRGWTRKTVLQCSLHTGVVVVVVVVVVVIVIVVVVAVLAAVAAFDRTW
jgi:hypothetical protein